MTNNGTTNILKAYLAENFHDKKFSVIDLKPFSLETGITIKSFKSSLGILTKNGLINNVGQILNPNGGSFITVYFIPDMTKLLKSCAKTKKELDQDKLSKFRVMNDAANRLAAALR